MLVYLDTAQFSYLENDPSQAVGDFITQWNKLGCVAAISFPHLQEIAQLGRVESIYNRFKSIWKLRRIGCRPVSKSNVLEFEILNQLNLFTNHAHFFPLLSEYEFPEIEEVTIAIMQQALSVQAAYSHIAEANNLAKEARRLAPLPSPETIIDPELVDIEKALEVMNQNIKDQPEHIRNLMNEMIPRLCQYIKEEGCVDLAVRRMMRDQGMCVGQSVSFVDLPTSVTFFEKARELIIPVLEMRGFEQTDVDKMVLTLDPYGAPSVSLNMAIERARSLQPQKDKSSDQIDMEHLYFAPHVDLMFIDKRTFEYVSQEARRNTIFHEWISSGRLQKNSHLEEAGKIINKIFQFKFP